MICKNKSKSRNNGRPTIHVVAKRPSPQKPCPPDKQHQQQKGRRARQDSRSKFSAQTWERLSPVIQVVTNSNKVQDTICGSNAPLKA